MGKYAIVVIAYNRKNSLIRLLESLEKVDYDGDEVPLIISIDYCGEDIVRKVAEDYQWPYGPKVVRTFQSRQGLRQHVLQCGEYLHEYDAIAVFEDDLYVAPGFYQFMKKTVPYYENDESIAGISLYSHRWNVLVDRAFEPIRSNFDVFFMQFAQSWGQIWMRKQWFAFKEWYEGLSDNDDMELMQCLDIPKAVRQWPSTSWLKYHVAYCIKKKKYFVYPYDSLTSNFSDAGQNSKKTTWRFQVPIQMTVKKEYDLQPNSEESVRYDGFFENETVARYLCVPQDAVCIDLYGSKPGNMGKRYWLTCRIVENNPIINRFGVQLRPHEVNVMVGSDGEDFVLYQVDKNIICTNEKKVDMRMVDYDTRGEGMALKGLLSLIVYRLRTKWNKRCV